MWVGHQHLADLSLLVKDKRRHVRHLDTEALARRGWQSALRVTSGRDGVAPTLAALSFAPTSADSRNGAARVDVTFRVTDALSGVTDRSGVGFRSDDPFRVSSPDTVVTSVSGTANDRTYHGYVLVPQCGSGQSTLRLVALLYDTAGNQRWIGSDELSALGFATDLSIHQRDLRPPTVESASASVGGSLALRFSEPVLVADPMAATLTVAVNGTVRAGAWQCRDGSEAVVVCDADDGADVMTASFTPTTPFVLGDVVRCFRRRALPPGSASTTSRASPWPSSPATSASPDRTVARLSGRPACNDRVCRPPRSR